MSQMKSWPIEKPKTGGKTCDPERRNRSISPEQKNGFGAMMVKKVVKS